MSDANDDECFGYWGGGNCSSAWYSWGRWVLLGVAVAAALVALISVRWYSMVQVRRGHRAPAGTGWMVPPSYYQSQQQHQGDTAAPPYNPNIGEHDAGYYDESGNFISKPLATPPTTHSVDEESAYHPSEESGPAGPHPDNYAPPAGPPPGTVSVVAPPGAPAGANAGSNAAGSGAAPSASAYYPPPPGPPPLAAKKR